MPHPRSPLSTEKVFIRFYNKAYRQIDIIWLDYEGKPGRFHSLQPNQFLDVNTYIGHLWMFTDTITGEEMHVLGKPIFPASYKVFGASVQRPEMRQPCRLCIPIFLPMQNLRQIALRAVYILLKDLSVVDKLELPMELRNELKKYGDR